MKNDHWRDQWHPCNSAMALALSGVTETPGVLTELPVSELNINLQNMPGVTEVCISGYCIPQDEVPSELTPLGEFVLLRRDNDIRKAYNYAFAASGNMIYFNGPYKYFEGHHTPLSGTVDIQEFFGHIPEKDLK